MILSEHLRVTNLKSKDVAKLVGVSPQFLCDVIKDRRRPTPHVAKAIFKCMGLSLFDRRFCVEFWTAPIMMGWKEAAE